MLGKLLKHEFRATGRVILPLSLVMLVLSLLANFSLRVLDGSASRVLNTLSTIILTAFGIGLVAIGLAALVIMIQRFRSSVLSDEGYLTMTLPVSTHSLIWSKLLVSLVWMVYAGLVVVISSIIMVFNLEGFWAVLRQLGPGLERLFEELSLLDINWVLLVIEWIVVGFVAAISGCLMLYASMSVGYSFTKHKALFSVLVFLGMSFIVNFVSPFLLVGLDNLFYGMADAGYYFRVLQTSTLALGAFQLALGAAYYFITVHCLKHRLNIQ